MDYLIFRSRAIQALGLVPIKQRKIMSKEELEQWIKAEYSRHYGKQTKGKP